MGGYGAWTPRFVPIHDEQLAVLRDWRSRLRWLRAFGHSVLQYWLRSNPRPFRFCDANGLDAGWRRRGCVRSELVGRRRIPLYGFWNRYLVRPRDWRVWAYHDVPAHDCVVS